MKLLLSFLLLCSYPIPPAEQEKEVYRWFLQENIKQTGTWITDNSAYMSEDEPFDQYGIEWTLSPLGNALYGRLFGIKEGKDVANFWDFHKYWDTAAEKAMLNQIGGDGTMGLGELIYSSSNSSELIQVFTSPDGSTFTLGHRSTFTDEYTEEGSSFSIDKEGQWTPDRSYIWKKRIE